MYESDGSQNSLQQNQRVVVSIRIANAKIHHDDPYYGDLLR